MSAGLPFYAALVWIRRWNLSQHVLDVHDKDMRFESRRIFPFPE